jgi:hypothetical protein
MGDDRMIRSGLINMIREKAQKGKSAYAIGMELGISKNTVKRYIAKHLNGAREWTAKPTALPERYHLKL